MLVTDSAREEIGSIHGVASRSKSVRVGHQWLMPSSNIFLETPGVILVAIARPEPKL